MRHSKQTSSEGCLFAQRWQWKKRGCSVHTGLRAHQKQTNRGGSVMMHESVRESRAPNTDQPVWGQTAFQLLHLSHRSGSPHMESQIYIYTFHQDSLGIVVSNKNIQTRLIRHQHFDKLTFTHKDLQVKWKSKESPNMQTRMCTWKHIHVHTLTCTHTNGCLSSC